MRCRWTPEIVQGLRTTRRAHDQVTLHRRCPSVRSRRRDRSVFFRHAWHSAVARRPRPEPDAGSDVYDASGRVVLITPHGDADDRHPGGERLHCPAMTAVRDEQRCLPKYLAMWRGANHNHGGGRLHFAVGKHLAERDQRAHGKPAERLHDVLQDRCLILERRAESHEYQRIAIPFRPRGLPGLGPLRIIEDRSDVAHMVRHEG